MRRPRRTNIALTALAIWVVATLTMWTVLDDHPPIAYEPDPATGQTIAAPTKHGPTGVKYITAAQARIEPSLYLAQFGLTAVLLTIVFWASGSKARQEEKEYWESRGWRQVGRGWRRVDKDD